MHSPKYLPVIPNILKIHKRQCYAGLHDSILAAYGLMSNTVQSRCCSQFSPKYSQYSYSSPVRVRYEVSFVSVKYNLYSTVAMHFSIVCNFFVKIDLIISGKLSFLRTLTHRFDTSDPYNSLGSSLPSINDLIRLLTAENCLFNPFVHSKVSAVYLWWSLVD